MKMLEVETFQIPNFPKIPPSGVEFYARHHDQLLHLSNLAECSIIIEFEAGREMITPVSKHLWPSTRRSSVTCHRIRVVEA